MFLANSLLSVNFGASTSFPDCNYQVTSESQTFNNVFSNKQTKYIYIYTISLIKLESLAQIFLSLSITTCDNKTYLLCVLLIKTTFFKNAHQQCI